MVRGEPPRLEGTLEVTVVDDDVGGPYMVGPRDMLEKTLRAAGAKVAVASQPRATRHTQRLIALYSEPRSWKGRADHGPQSLRLLRQLAPRAALVVLFGHPRLAAQIPGTAPVLCAWHGQPVMQRAAARWLLSNA
jgi:hypothetical protein